MGHLFQMKNGGRYSWRWILVLAMLLGGAQQIAWAEERFVYEQHDADQEKKQYAVKLEQDRQKCDLAIGNTKTLIGRSKSKPYLPELYLRLAELYIEKSRIVYFMRKSQLKEGEDPKALDQYEANMLKQQAIEIYQRILSQHADFDQCDKARFFMAHEYRELGQIDEMIKQYETLIANYPNSTYVPEAHLLLGDYYFSQKQDVSRSKASYEAVLKYPRSPAVAAARYKLAWCQINLADYAGAIKLFEESVESPQAKQELNIDTYRRVDVRLESLVDMAYCYPEVYKQATPEEALAYFKKHSWSRPVYTTVLEKLGYRYYVKKNWTQCAAIYRELATIRQDPDKLAEYAKLIVESVQAMGTYEHAEKDVQIIIRAAEKQKYSAHVTDEEKAKLLKEHELYARQIITHLHSKARNSNSKGDFKVAAEAYGLYLDFFKQSPAKEEMAANAAEALFSSGDYLKAGKQYEKSLPSAAANRQQRVDALYGAIISYYQALKNKDNLNFYQAAFAREGLRAAGKSFATEFPSSPNTPEVRFNVAWAAYDAGQYDEAIRDFSDFVTAYPNHQATGAAVHLVMDAYHQTDNYEGMIKYGNGVLANSGIGDPKLKQEVAQIVQGAESKVVSSMTMAAVDDYESARKDLMQVANQSGTNGLGEQALNALVLSSKDKKDLPTLYDAGTKLVQQYPQSQNAKTTLGFLIDTSVKIGQYRLLADYLELYVERYPGDAHATLFVTQAAQIREGLGQYGDANRDYRRLLRQPGISVPQLENALFSCADNAQQMGNTEAALQVLEENVGRLSGEAQLRAKAQMAVLNLRADRRARAESLAREVKQAYQPAMGQKDPVLLDLVAESIYNEVYHASGRYFGLKLKGKIDDQLVAQKTEMLALFEKGYQRVIELKAPAWALKACFRAGELNREYADFLIDAPLPAELSAQERQQYQDLIKQKAQAYVDKADEYQKTCIQMAHKWEICDPRLAGYFNPAEHPQGREDAVENLSGRRTSSEIALQGLSDPALQALYQRLLQAPDDAGQQLALAKTYLEKGDFRQASLIAENSLTKARGGGKRVQADLLNLLGVTQLDCAQDPLAKETFKKALAADSDLNAARVNLAGIYRHYGHHAKADELMRGVQPTGADKEGIHPRIGAISNAYVLQTR
jgi:tetratricopeptide (TPR) repeat protein